MKNKIKKLLEELLAKLRVSVEEIEIEEKEPENYYVNLKTADAKLLIGYHGETIFALQHLLKIFCWKKFEKENLNIHIDIDQYREKQEENVKIIADKKAELVRKTLKTQSLPPMSPYFRRIIHLYLLDDKFNDLETESVGKGDMRHVVVKLKKLE